MLLHITLASQSIKMIPSAAGCLTRRLCRSVTLSNVIMEVQDQLCDILQCDTAQSGYSPVIRKKCLRRTFLQTTDKLNLYFSFVSIFLQYRSLKLCVFELTL